MEEHVDLRETRVRECWAMAYECGRRWAYRYGVPQEMEDFTAEAFVGLVEALDSFDPGRGCKFSTHAYWAMARRLERYGRAAELRGMRGGTFGSHRGSLRADQIRFAETVSTAVPSHVIDKVLSIQNVPERRQRPPCKLPELFDRRLRLPGPRPRPEAEARVRQVMSMHFVEELSAPKIAEKLGWTTGRVKQTIRYGLWVLSRSEGLKEELVEA